MVTCSVEGCCKKVMARGWCPAHYSKWKKYGDPLAVKQKQMHGSTLEERFWANVQKSTKCWEWSGYRDPNGYGRLNVENYPTLAHRISWEIRNGPITSAQHVLHKCDNPCCVRPGHLFLGDHAMNMADKMAKKRHVYGISQGEAHGCSKLTTEQVLEIRASADKGIDLAKRYGVSTAQISDIRNRRSWRHV